MIPPTLEFYLTLCLVDAVQPAPAALSVALWGMPSMFFLPFPLLFPYPKYPWLKPRLVAHKTASHMTSAPGLITRLEELSKSFLYSSIR